MSKLTKALAVLLVFGAVMASAQQVPAYARTRFETYLTNASNCAVMNSYKLSGFNYNGKALPRMVIDSVRIVGATAALTCTLDFNRDIFYPFIFTSKAAGTATFKMFNVYGDGTPSEFSVAGDSLAFGLPTYGQRFVFTVASADTGSNGIAFYVVGFPVPSPN